MLRIIGDIHGNYREYRKIIKNVSQSLQVGDMGLDYLGLMDKDPDIHKFIGGNHDNYDHVHKILNYLGDFGVWKSDIGDIFHVRGAWSIDNEWRKNYEKTKGFKTWWEQEELTDEKFEECVKLYTEVKPKFVVSHACPQSIQKYVTDREFQAQFGFSTDQELTSRTCLYLQQMYEIHAPKVWVFGHYHTYKNWFQDQTRFICLNMCPDTKWFIDVMQLDEENWSII